MTTPIPRPPGPWRALARDARLNPEEAAARTIAIDECRRLADAASVPRWEPSPHERLVRYQSIIDRSGWKVSFVRGDERARIEAFHPSGAAVMATAKAGRDCVNLYVLAAAPTEGVRWLHVSAGSFTYFLEHVALPEGTAGMRVPFLCRCAKSGRYPTEACARAVMVDVTIRRVLKRHSVQGERRAYRCPDDDRVWHLTRRAKWYDAKKPEPQKGTTR
ncbi:hypothetical protein [Streptomyces mirabilis]|uniref:hypothetical protein n=1 Tax=Streptomyces mirabilis TaxID=68239 RepID=UPI0036B4D7F0